MKLIYLFLALGLLIGFNAYSQNGRDIHGSVIDSTKQTLPGSTVRIYIGKDSLTTTTNEKGQFLFQKIKAKQISILVNSIGFNPVRRLLKLDSTNNPVFLKPIILKQSNNMLNTVVISDVLAVKIKEDTVEFNAAAYKVRDGAPVEEMIKKIPGADVDKDGNISFQGKSVTKVRVNGKEFFGGDLKTATQNLPADAVQNVQMVNDYGDQANLTGIKTGEPETILNINIKPSRNHGYFGQASAGGGMDDIPQVAGAKDATRYIAQANMFKFNDNQQIAILGNYNNTNTNLFNFGGGGGGGGGGRQGGGGGPGGGNSSNTNGITTARSIGFNYRDSWGKKVTVYGSYSFSDNSVNTVSSTLQQNLNPLFPSTNSQNSQQNDGKINHRFTFNIEYKPDTINYFKISPSFSYASVNTIQTGSNILIGSSPSDYNFVNNSNSTTPNYGINVLYNHRFNGKGRNFSINLGFGNTNTDQFQNPVDVYITGKPNSPLNQSIQTNSRTDTLGTSISYIEPLSKHSYAELNYNYKYSYTSDDKQTDTLTNVGALNNYPLLSNNYNFTFITNRFGANYRYVQKKYNLVLGITAQPSTLEGSTAAIPAKNNFNISPNAHFVYNYSRTQSLSINFSGSSNQPSYTQLQPVTDFSNTLYPVTGNPDLKPEYNNTFSLRYNKFNFESGNVFFSNFSIVQTEDKIVSNTITYPKKDVQAGKLAGTIATEYLNAPGYYSANAFYVFAKPWDKRKYNLFLRGSISYNNNISYITNVDTTSFKLLNAEKNIAKNLVLSQGLRFRVDITDIIDAEANTTYTVNASKNSLSQQNINDNYRSWAVGLNGKNYLWKDWTVSYDYTKTYYYGYQGSTNPNIFNTYVERRFLKGNMATLRLAAMDVFNENTGYTVSQNGSNITTSNVNRLGRYYLLTFTYRFQKMTGKRPEMGPGRGFGPPPGGGMGGPPGGGGM